MSLVNPVARTATRDELVELLRQHDTELVAERLKTAKLMELARGVTPIAEVGIHCADVGDKNWFDARDELLR